MSNLCEEERGRKEDRETKKKAGTKGMSIDKVSARHFYLDDGDKILLNWSMYEYANILFSEIEKSPELGIYRKRQSEEEIVAFCVYFSKRLRRSIVRANEKRTSRMEIDARYVYEFYPKNSYMQTQRLLEAAGAAWDEHIMACSKCPNGCLMNGFERTSMFDNLEKTGWPTI
jgi:hypothetical protein